jgi:hypothetical protein
VVVRHTVLVQGRTKKPHRPLRRVVATKVRPPATRPSLPPTKNLTCVLTLTRGDLHLAGGLPRRSSLQLLTTTSGTQQSQGRQSL